MPSELTSRLWNWALPIAWAAGISCSYEGTPGMLAGGKSEAPGVVDTTKLPATTACPSKLGADTDALLASRAWKAAAASASASAMSLMPLFLSRCPEPT